MLQHMANEEFPWIVVAELYECSSPTAKLVLQTEAKLEDDGFIRFENLSISEITSSFKISYKFKTPSGLNDTSYKPPSFNSTKTTTSTKAEFTCASYQKNMAVLKNGFFNISVSVLDKETLKPVKNLDWKNHTWEASIGMYQLDKCQSNGQLKIDMTNTSANLVDGVFSFENLYITQSGMYMLSIMIRTSNDEFSFNCLSNSITVTETQAVLDDTVIPSTVLKFQGNFADFKDKVENIKAKFFNCYVVKNGLTITTPISVYEGSIMLNCDVSGSVDGMTKFGQDVVKGIELETGMSLISATVNDVAVTLNNTLTADVTNTNSDPVQIKSSAIPNVRIFKRNTFLILLYFFSSLIILCLV